MTPHRLYAIRLSLIVLTAIIAFGSFAYAASAKLPARTPQRMPMIGTATIHWNADIAAECGTPVPLGCATPWTGDVYVPAGVSRMTLQHELGHVFIWRALYQYDGQFDYLVPRPSMLWAISQIKATLHFGQARDFWGDGASPSEFAAEAYALCATGNGPAWGRVKDDGRIVRYLTGPRATTAYGYSPTLRMHLSMCSLFHKIERAAA